MNTIIKFKTMEQSDRLFVVILCIAVTVYSLVTTVLILNRSEVDLFASPPAFSKRMTRLIVNLPKPAPRKKVAKIQPKKSKVDPVPEKRLADVKPEKKLTPPKPKKTVPELKPKMRVAGVKPEKKVTKAKEATKPLKPSPPIPRKKVEPKSVAVKEKGSERLEEKISAADFEELGILNVIGVLDEEEEGVSEPDESRPVLFEGEAAAFSEHQIFDGNEQPEVEPFLLVEEREEVLTAQMEEDFEGPGEFEELFPVNDFLEIEQPDNSDAYARDGTRNSEIIQKIVSDYTNGMRFCYNNSLRKVETLKGTVVVKFTILASGMTDKVSIISNEIRDQRLEHCIIGIIFRWEFPPSKIDKLVVTYPISFVKTS
ncbi:MAG: AgmX/PglI C-terminal domain-containing protein [Nitrospinota bacterium]